MTRTTHRPTRVAVRIAIAIADTGPLLPPIDSMALDAWAFCFLPAP